MKHRPYTSQEKARIVALKQAFRGLHEGPMGVPRKVVFAAMGMDPGQYSRLLNLEDFSTLPSVLDVQAAVAETGNPAPLRAMCAVGEGWRVVPDTSEPTELEGGETTSLHITGLQASHPLQLVLAKIVADQLITRDEAREALPLLQEQHRWNVAALDQLQRIAGGVE